MQMCTPRSNHCHPYRRRKVIRLWKSVVAGAVTLIFVLCVVVPLVFHYSPGLQRFFLFLNTVTTPISLNRPEDVGLPGTRNFYLKTDKDVTIGIWHILPRSLIHSVPDDVREWPVWYESSLKQQQPIILYLHGNKGSRAESHRVELYNKLRKMDYHVITLDYRGYGDSSSVAPSEEGLVADAKAVFRYLRDKSGHSPLFVWGHSLGTGVSCHALSELCQENLCPQGLVLEAPFNNLHDEIRLNPLSQVFHSLPYFDWAFIDPIRDSGNEFKSDSHITHIACPVLILHAQDDIVVPIELGRKLYKAAKDARLPDAMPVTFVELEAEYGFGHLDIPHAPNFLSIIRKFVDKPEAKNLS
ncbi:hypothetical protein O3P69_000955 [Scylla paramamosain]|uniref:AB hydrolase-1 domain-containing protein n=1 Tax=Scylla paramamosain TaxID=85552 RepID=A0AAW0UT80_SCYPA